METAIMENSMEKKMENEMQYIGVIYYSSFHFLGIPSARVLYWVKFLDIRREGCAAALKHVRRTHKHAQHLAWLSFFVFRVKYRSERKQYFWWDHEHPCRSVAVITARAH